MTRLVYSELPATGQRDPREPAPALLLDGGAADAALREGGDKRIDVVRHEVELVRLIPLGGMNGQLRWRKTEDEPTVTDIDVGEPKHIANEGAVGLGVRAVDDRVRSGDHTPIVRP